MENLSQKQKIAMIIVGVFVVGIFAFYMVTKDNQNIEYIDTNNLIENKESDINEKEELGIQTIIIHLTGAVKNEGIVEIRKGDRIADAIEEAGGLTQEADLSKVNLAYILKDGQKVYIPRINDNEEGVIFNENETGIIVEDTNYTEEINLKININTAGLSELATLQGIGEGTASKIVEYRQVYGEFKTIEDIKNVSGIGEAKFSSIKENICVN